MTTCNCVDCEECPFETKNIHKETFFEVHVTVAKPNIDKFIEDCKTIGIKPILLDLYLKDETTIKDVMTSSKYECSETEIIIKSDIIVAFLKNQGYDVLRVKIETVPWHPDAPSLKNDKHFHAGQYFESHLQVKCRADDMWKLKSITDPMHLHLSKNAFKKDGEMLTVMATLRWYSGFIEQFKIALGDIKRIIEEQGFEVSKEIIEFTWFDSKIDHDNIWIKNGPVHQN